MIAKNIKGKSFGGCVRYVMSKGSELLEAEGVFADSAESIIRSFQLQRSQRSEIKQPVGHIPIAFSPEDSHRMTNEFMLQLAKEYMNEMGIGNTQCIIVRHHNTDHDHLHIVYNRIDNDLKLISANNDYKRNIVVCKKLKDRHGLTYGKDKMKVKIEKLHGKEKAKYGIYHAIRDTIIKSHNMDELTRNLQLYGVSVLLKYRSGTDIVEGISFQKGEYKFKGSEIDRRFSYKGLHSLFQSLAVLEEQKRKAASTPTVKGVKLTQEQWHRLQDGKSVWLDNMQRKDGNGTFSAYATLTGEGKMVSFSKMPIQKSIIPETVKETAQTVGDVTSNILSAVSDSMVSYVPNPDYNHDQAEAERLERIKKKKRRGRRV